MAIQREEKRQIKKEHYDSLDIDKMRVVFFGRRYSFQIRERCGRLHDNLIGDILRCWLVNAKIKGGGAGLEDKVFHLLA